MHIQPIFVKNSRKQPEKAKKPISSSTFNISKKNMTTTDFIHKAAEAVARVSGYTAPDVQPVWFGYVGRSSQV